MIGWLDAQLVSIVDGVAYGLLIFTLAAGLSLIFGTMDVLNLAHGTCYLAGGYLAFRLSDGGWLGFVLAIVAGLLAGAVGGVLLAAVTRPVWRRGHLDQALLTLGIALVGSELFLVASRGDPLAITEPTVLGGTVSLAGHPYPGYRLLFIVVAAVLAGSVFLMMERSGAGALVRAVVADRAMVQAIGIRTGRVQTAVFATGVALATLGGVLGAPIIGPAPGVDERVLVLCLVVVVVGGRGSIGGVLLGALVIGQVQSLGVALVPRFAPFLIFGSMALMLAIRPHGLVRTAAPT